MNKILTAGQAAPWLTLVHGASQNSKVFSAQIEAFSSHYRLLLIDLPGHGKSSEMKGPYGPEEYAAAVLAAIDSAGIACTSFWGTHTGAGVGLTLATRHPRRFHAFVLEGAVIPGVDLPSITTTVSRAKITARTQGIEAAKLEWFREAEWFRVIREHPEPCRAQAHWALIAEFVGGPWLDESMPQAIPPLREKLASISKPVLLINGEHDLADFLVIADELAATLPHAQRVIIPGAGGFPLWEVPTRVNPCVSDFLSGVLAPK